MKKWQTTNNKNDRKIFVRFQVLTAVSMKMIAYWNIAPCSLVVEDLRFRGSYCLHHQGDE
jgi:hypothetical protein